MCIKVRPHAAWIGQCRRIKAIGTGVLWPDYNCPQHGRLREFSGGRKHEQKVWVTAGMHTASWSYAPRFRQGRPIRNCGTESNATDSDRTTKLLLFW